MVVRIVKGFECQYKKFGFCFINNRELQLFVFWIDVDKVGILERFFRQWGVDGFERENVWIKGKQRNVIVVILVVQ